MTQHKRMWLTTSSLTLSIFVIVMQVGCSAAGENIKGGKSLFGKGHAEEESCYSYGPDRHVYPQGSPTSDHKLQYTKAVSKFWNLWNFWNFYTNLTFFSFSAGSIV